MSLSPTPEVLHLTLAHLNNVQDRAALLQVRKDFYQAHENYWKETTLPPVPTYRAYTAAAGHAQPRAPICQCCASACLDDAYRTEIIVMWTWNRDWWAPEVYAERRAPRWVCDLILQSLAKRPRDVARAAVAVMLEIPELPGSQELIGIVSVLAMHSEQAMPADLSEVPRDSLVHLVELLDWHNGTVSVVKALQCPNSAGPLPLSCSKV